MQTRPKQCSLALLIGRTIVCFLSSRLPVLQVIVAKWILVVTPFLLAAKIIQLQCDRARNPYARCVRSSTTYLPTVMYVHLQGPISNPCRKPPLPISSDNRLGYTHWLRCKDDIVHLLVSNRNKDEDITWFVWIFVDLAWCAAPIPTLLMIPGKRRLAPLDCSCREVGTLSDMRLASSLMLHTLHYPSCHAGPHAASCFGAWGRLVPVKICLPCILRQ